MIAIAGIYGTVAGFLGGVMMTNPETMVTGGLILSFGAGFPAVIWALGRLR